MSDAPEFSIRPARLEHAATLIAGNLAISISIMVVVFVNGQQITEVDTTDLLFEGFSAVAAFAIFVAASLVVVTITSMPLLLLGVLLFQMGRLLDVADEIVYFPFSFWSVMGDALVLAGELILAAVAIYFVRISFRIANLDGLTGLCNRAFYLTRLADMLNLSAPRGQLTGVITIDLDRFKKINDKLGHAYGDLVLQHTARLLKRYRRGGNIVSRTGGEEFELAIPNTTAPALLQLAEEIRSTLESNPPAKIDALTASIGVAITRDGDTFEKLRTRADEGAYTAKKAGRNRVVMIDD